MIDPDSLRWRQLRDMARTRGQVVVLDRLDDGVIVMVGGERQTSEGASLEEAFEIAARRCGLHEQRLNRDTAPTLPDLPNPKG